MGVLYIYNKVPLKLLRLREEQIGENTLKMFRSLELPE